MKEKTTHLYVDSHERTLILHSLATPEEQEILSRYVGWGGLSMAFDEHNAAWADEFKELYASLSPEEYNAAMESSCTFIPPLPLFRFPLLRESRARASARALSRAMPPCVWRAQSLCLPVSSFRSLRLRPLRLTQMLRRCLWYGAISESLYLICSSL